MALRVQAAMPALMKLFHQLVDVSRPFHLTLLNVAVTAFQSSRPSHSLTSMFTKADAL